MHQLLTFLIYQLDRVTRVLMTKERSYLDTIDRLEEQVKQLKMQLNSTRHITESYKKLELDY